MKYILEYEEFLLEANTGRKEKNKQQNINDLYKSLTKIYELFKKSNKIYLSNEEFKPIEFLKKENIKNYAAILRLIFKYFLNSDLVPNKPLYSLKTNEAPTKELTEKILNELSSDFIDRRNILKDTSPKYDGLSQEEAVLLALQTIYREIEQNNGNAYPSRVFFNLSPKFNIICTKILKLYDSYSLSKDPKTLKEVEQYFSSKVIDKHEFSKTKHNLYVWLANEPTLNMAKEVVKKYNEYTMSKFNNLSSSLNDEERSNFNISTIKTHLRRKGASDEEINDYIKFKYKQIKSGPAPTVNLKNMSKEEKRTHVMKNILRRKGMSEEDINDYIKNKYKQRK